MCVCDGDRCEDGHQLAIEKVKSLVMVLEAEKPIITLDAQKSVETEEQKLIRGEKIFHDLHIAAHTKAEEAELSHADLKVRTHGRPTLLL